MQIQEKIHQYKQQLGDKLLLLAHYYQNDDIFKLADVTGDSYGLAVAASRSQAKYIVMCGVLFMAETNRLLIGERQRAFTPEKQAGCPMAEMIDEKNYWRAMEKINAASGKKPRPLLYVNSTMATKAAAGADGGICCTSSNAEKILRQLLAKGETVFFLPDRNLASNCGKGLGLKDNEIAIVGRGTASEEINSQAKLYVWDGYCIVHERVETEDVANARRIYPTAKIIVHPECGVDIVDSVDYAGSTKQLLDYFYEVPAGSELVVGTERNFVERLKRLRDDVKIHHLLDSACVNMAKITLDKLERCLAAIAAGDEKTMMEFEVQVEEEHKEPARQALQRMISAVES